MGEKNVNYNHDINSQNSHEERWCARALFIYHDLLYNLEIAVRKLTETGHYTSIAGTMRAWASLSCASETAIKRKEKAQLCFPRQLARLKSKMTVGAAGIRSCRISLRQFI